MASSEFSATDWIDRLTPALTNLAKAQIPYLEEYYKHNTFVQEFEDWSNGETPVFPLDDLRLLYVMARRGNIRDGEGNYAPLCEVLDPVRHILRSHPTLARVASPIIGKDEFWMDILNSGGLTYTTDLIAGLIARASELSEDGYRTAVAELNELLDPVPVAGQVDVPGELGVGFDAVLFFGLTFKHRIDIVDGMVVLPFEQIRRFVDQNLVNELAPPGAGFHGWRSLGAVVRPFHWRPEFRRTGRFGDRVPRNPRRFFRDAVIFLDLLAIAHATPVPYLATMENCIDRSAGRLLGLADRKNSHNPGRSVQSFDGFDLCPEPLPTALDEAIDAFNDRESARFASVTTEVSRLSEALVREGRFPDENRFLKVAIVLERMYDLPERMISQELRNRASLYLGPDSQSQERIRKDIKEFYDTRSNIVHRGSDNVPQQERFESFDKGFDIAKQTLFKLLREGPPENWDEVVAPNTEPNVNVNE